MEERMEINKKKSIEREGSQKESMNIEACEAKMRKWSNEIDVYDLKIKIFNWLE